MTTIAKNFNTDLNFWELNPMFKTVKRFLKLYEDDKSKGKKDSSQLMWAIALLIDPNEANIWRNLSEEDKKMLIRTEFLNEKDYFKWEDHQELIDEYENRCLTIAEKELIRFERKLVDRGNFIAKTTYKLDEYEEDNGKVKLIKGTAEQLDKMMLNTTKINEQYSIIKDMLKQEEAQGSLRAGAKKSASESKRI